jgi:hypothetical protein
VDAVLDRPTDLDDVADAAALVELARALPLVESVAWVRDRFA